MKEVEKIVHVTIEEAVKLREGWRDEIRNADRIVREVPRLCDYVRSWLRSKALGLKPSTAKSYADVLGGQVGPYLGDFFLDKITDQNVREMQLTLAETLSPATVNGAVIMLRMVLADAMAEFRLPHNPAARVRRLRVRAFTDEEPNILTREELARLLVAFRDRIPKWYPLAAALAFTGMRFGEVTALKWNDIDENAGIIRVTRAQWEGHVGTTKTGIIRSVPLVPILASVLRDHRTRLTATQCPGLAEGWVFLEPDGALLRKCALRFPLRRAAQLAGIKKRITTHGLRRTFNNLSRQLNGEIVTRAMTGHVTAAMTEHYSHVGPEEKIAAVGRIASIVDLDAVTRGDPGGELTRSQSAPVPGRPVN